MRCAAHACPVLKAEGVRRALPALSCRIKGSCPQPDGSAPELVCRLHCLARLVCHRQGRTADIISVRRGCPLTAVVTVQMLLYHVCNRFARLSGRFSPNFCISAQFFVWKSVAFLRISEETEQDSPIQIVTFSEILSYFRLTKQKKSGGCRTGKTIFLGNLSYCR